MFGFVTWQGESRKIRGLGPGQGSYININIVVIVRFKRAWGILVSLQL